MTRIVGRAALLAGASLMAASQPACAAPGERHDDDGDGKKTPAPIVVTGSRIRGAKVADEVNTVTREAIAASGQVDLGEALRALPENFSGGQNPAVGTGAGLVNSNVNSASAPNLRGLGPDATLTLLNGHRLPYDSAFGGVDISAIPLAAIDRIEVVPDGASALYGSDAVAGVVNVILRRDFRGASASAQLGASTPGGYVREQADLVAGDHWEGGGVLLAYDFSHSTSIAARQRPYAAALDPAVSLYPRQTRHALTFSGHQMLAPGVELALDALYSVRRSESIGGTAAARYVSQPRLETATLAPSLTADIGPAWQARATGIVGRDRTRYRTAFSPLGGATAVTTGCFCNDVAALELGAEGPLLALPGGVLRLAFGAGLRSNGLAYSQAVGRVTSRAFDERRKSRYAYAELFAPLVSPQTDVHGVSELSLSAAVRYEDYPGLARLATPKLGIVYAPVREVLVRGTWSRSFKAPTLYQQYIPYQAYLLPSLAFGAGAAGQTVIYASGGNPDVRPERARSWTLGLDLRPRRLQGVTASATYFRIRYSDRVVQPIAGSIAAAFRDRGYSALIDFDPAPAYLRELVAGAQLGLQNFAGVPYDPAQVFAFVDNRNINVAVQSIHGIDARVGWNGILGHADKVSFQVAGTWLASSQRLTSALPPVQLAGMVFNPPRLRWRATGAYRHGPFSATPAVNFTGALRDERFAKPARLAPSATVDLAVSYDVVRSAGGEPRLTLQLSGQNLLNDRPEVIGVSGPTDTPYDSTNFSPIGRFIAVGLRGRW